MLRDRRPVSVNPNLLPPLDQTKMAQASIAERHAVEVNAISLALNRAKIEEIRSQIKQVQPLSPSYDHLMAQLNHLIDQTRRSYAIVEPFQKSMNSAW
jgi:hypothetical protein